MDSMSGAEFRICVNSEIGKLDAVLLHPPGAEVENMTPRNVQRALYSDILNLSIALEEYRQLQGVLSKVSKVYLVDELLVKVLDNQEARQGLLRRICDGEDAADYYDELLEMPSKALARVLVEGLPAKIDSLTAFLRDEYYALYPLYNFYFTRDAAVTIGNSALICRMANKVRMRESYIMDAIYRHSGVFDCSVVDANEFEPQGSSVMMEGGDILVAREDILLLGNGCRTSSQGIDFLLDGIRKEHDKGRFHVVVQQLPSTPESFIHLDMVFTFLDRDKCMIFEPLILGDNQYQTVHIIIEDGKVSKISSAPDILTVLRRLGMDLEPLVCGGVHERDQEREQWHSGANCFAFAPGKVMTYGRNVHTLEVLDRKGFELVSADDVISGRVSVDGDGLFAVTIAGSELPRGGGGARCMTMPLLRRPVAW